MKLTACNDTNLPLPVVVILILDAGILKLRNNKAGLPSHKIDYSGPVELYVPSTLKSGLTFAATGMSLI